MKKRRKKWNLLELLKVIIFKSTLHSFITVTVHYESLNRWYTNCCEGQRYNVNHSTFSSNVKAKTRRSLRGFCMSGDKQYTLFKSFLDQIGRFTNSNVHVDSTNNVVTDRGVCIHWLVFRLMSKTYCVYLCITQFQVANYLKVNFSQSFIYFNA